MGKEKKAGKKKKCKEKESVMEAIKPKPGEKGGASVPSKAILGYKYKNSLPDGSLKFEEHGKALKEETKALFEEKGVGLPSDGSLKNSTGRWMEYIFAVYAWNTLSKLNSSSDSNCYIYVKLPNKNDDEDKASKDADKTGQAKTIWTSLLDSKHQKLIKSCIVLRGRRESWHQATPTQ